MQEICRKPAGKTSFRFRGWTLRLSISHNAGFSQRGFFLAYRSNEKEGLVLIVNSMSNFVAAHRRKFINLLLAILAFTVAAPATLAQPREGGEAALKLPDLSDQM